MLNFKAIELKDKQWINERLKESDFKGCEYSFANNFIWSIPNKIEFADVNNFYCLKSEWDKGISYTFPAGKGDIKSTIELLINDAQERGYKFYLRGIIEEEMERLKQIFPDKFDFYCPREECDYIYTSEKLISLSGKKLHGKRNHIARFKDNNNWIYEDINKENINDCLDMSEEWCRLYSQLDDEGLKNEICAVKQAFKYYFELGFKGGLIRADNKVVAFTIGEPLSSDTFVVHIEKAFAEIQGAYPIINQQFAEHNCKEFKYVNREEDVGDEGLRKAKLSYYPEIILEKYTAVIKEK